MLFRDLQKKKLKPDDKQIMNELMQEHILGRTLTGQLVDAKSKFITGERTALATIIDLMQQLVDFYPKHIEKEDKIFFKSAMKYFTTAEKDAMLDEEYEFDKKFIHVIYRNVVAEAEQAFS
ncbi:MAG: hemerythrin domain-containing protein [Candidatus Odinarchaeota archaeon]